MGDREVTETEDIFVERVKVRKVEKNNVIRHSGASSRLPTRPDSQPFSPSPFGSGVEHFREGTGDTGEFQAVIEEEKQHSDSREEEKRPDPNEKEKAQNQSSLLNGNNYDEDDL